jgi:multicomponent Na+:H+ antiporter subunit E
MLRIVILSLPLFLLYLGLTANLELSNLIAGFLISFAIILLLRPERRKINPKNFPSALFAFIIYLMILLLDLIKSGIQVARIVLSPSLPIKPGIIAIQSECETEIAKALSAHAITLTPGELVVEIGPDGTMYTHILDIEKAQEYIAEAQEMRESLLRKIFS